MDENKVTIRIWKSPSLKKGFGHVSLQTHIGGSTDQGVYVSFWPPLTDDASYQDIPFKISSFPKKGGHLRTELYDSIQEGRRAADFKIDLYGFDINKINLAFEEFKNRGSRWASLGSSVLKFDNFNCCGLIARLLYVASNESQKRIMEYYYPFYFKKRMIPISHWPQHVKNFQVASRNLLLLMLLGCFTASYVSDTFNFNNIWRWVALLFGQNLYGTAYIDYLLFQDNLISPNNFDSLIKHLKILDNAKLHTTKNPVNSNKNEIAISKKLINHGNYNMKVGLGEINPIFSIFFNEFLPDRLSDQRNYFWRITDSNQLSDEAVSKNVTFKLSSNIEKQSTQHSDHNAIIRIWRSTDVNKEQHISLEVFDSKKTVYFSLWPHFTNEVNSQKDEYLYLSLGDYDLRTLHYDSQKLEGSPVLIYLSGLKTTDILEEFDRLANERIKHFESSIQMVSTFLKIGGFDLDVPLHFYHQKRLNTNTLKLCLPAIITGGLIGYYNNGLLGLISDGLMGGIFSTVYYHSCFKGLKEQRLFIRLDCEFDGIIGSFAMVVFYKIAEAIMFNYYNGGMWSGVLGFLTGAVKGLAFSFLGLPIHMLLSQFIDFLKPNQYFSTPEDIFHLFYQHPHYNTQESGKGLQKFGLFSKALTSGTRVMYDLTAIATMCTFAAQIPNSEESIASINP